MQCRLPLWYPVVSPAQRGQVGRGSDQRCVVCLPDSSCQVTAHWHNVAFTRCSPGRAAFGVRWRRSLTLVDRGAKAASSCAAGACMCGWGGFQVVARAMSGLLSSRAPCQTTAARWLRTSTTGHYKAAWGSAATALGWQQSLTSALVARGASRSSKRCQNSDMPSLQKVMRQGKQCCGQVLLPLPFPQRHAHMPRKFLASHLGKGGSPARPVPVPVLVPLPLGGAVLPVAC